MAVAKGRLLVVFLHGFGDNVMATPAIKELSLTNTVDIATYDKTLADKLWRNLSFVGDVYNISLSRHPRYWNPILFWLRDYWEVKRKIDAITAHRKYDAVIFSKIYMLPHFAYLIFPFLLRRRHKIDQIALELGINRLADRRTTIRFPAKSTADGEAFLERNNITESDRLVTMHLLTTDRKRDIPLPVAISLIEKVSERSRGLKFVVLGTRDTYREEFERYKMHLQGGNVACTYAEDGELDLMTCGYLIKRSSVFVGIDSGPFHIAGALGVNTVGVFRSPLIKSDQRKAANDNIVCFDGVQLDVDRISNSIADFVANGVNV